jgi:hypothetical protein
VSVFRNEDHEYEMIGRRFQAQYGGVCTINMDHIVKRQDWVSKVQFADNPMLPVSGVACTSCTRILSHA